VLKAEAESASSLAFVHEEVDESARKVALIEGELANMHQAQDMTEVNFQGLSDKVTDVDWRRDNAKRLCRDLV
jgi:hypothetical protein